MKYDYFVAGRWRNHRNITPIVEKIRASGKKVYYFVENQYDAYDINADLEPDDLDAKMTEEEQMKDWRVDPLFRKIFETDMQGLKEAKAIVVVFPIGFSVHMELGAAYGMGKKCYGIGQPEKAETLYFIFDEIFPTAEKFLEIVR
jgi:hypothetical protein